MRLDTILSYCHTLTGTEETFPFGPETLVLKVKGKMYALIDVESPTSVNLKCDPEEAIDLRERYDAVRPGFHMNKKHWNTVLLNGEINDGHLKEMIANSYNLVVKSLTKKLQNELSAG